MGKSISKQEVNNIVNSFLDITVKQSLNNSVDLDCFNVVNLKNCKNVSGLHIDQSCYVKVNLASFQSDQTKADIANEIQAKIDQESKSISKKFNLDFSKKELDEVTNALTNLKEAILISFSNSCEIRSSTGNAFTCENSKNIHNLWLTQKNFQEHIINCVQKNKTFVDAKNKLEQVLTQKNTLKVTGSNLFLLIIVVIILVGLVYLYKFYDKKNDNSKKKNIKVAGILVVSVILVIFIYIIFKKSSKNNEKR